MMYKFSVLSWEFNKEIPSFTVTYAVTSSTYEDYGKYVIDIPYNQEPPDSFVQSVKTAMINHVKGTSNTWASAVALNNLTFVESFDDIIIRST